MQSEPVVGPPCSVQLIDAGTDNNLSCIMYPRRLGFVDVRE